jgi:hypothetical protein
MQPTAVHRKRQRFAAVHRRQCDGVHRLPVLFEATIPC